MSKRFGIWIVRRHDWHIAPGWPVGFVHIEDARTHLRNMGYRESSDPTTERAAFVAELDLSDLAVPPTQAPSMIVSAGDGVLVSGEIVTP